MKTQQGYQWKKNVVAFMGSQAISIFGSSLVQYAITWHITLTTQSGIFATLSIICGFVPTLLLSPFAGVWADRYDRKRLIILADGGIALATMVLAFLFMGGHESIWLLLGAMAVRALGGAVQQPCINAMLPDIVPTEHLTRVNGINSSLNSLITLASPMVAGALITFVPLSAIFFIDVATAAAAILVMLFLFRLPEKLAAQKPEGQEQGGYFGEMKRGFAYVAKHAYLRNFFVFMTIFNFLAAPIAFLTPLQVTRNYGGEVWHLTALEMVFSVGMLIGGLTISAWGGFKNRIHTMGAAALMMGIGVAVMGLPLPLWPYLIVMGIGGLVMPMVNTPAIVMLQERVEPEYMGRIFSLMTMISSSVMPLGMLLFGPLADVVRIEYLLLCTGVVMAVASLMIFRNKALIRAGHRLEKVEGGQRAA